MLGDPAPNPPRVEDTGRRDKPSRPLYGHDDIPLLLDTIDELRARIYGLDPGGLTTDDPGGW